MDRQTGIRYGVFNLNSSAIVDWLLDYIENEYQAYCPHCEVDIDTSKIDVGDSCPHCEVEIEEYSWSEEPISRTIERDGVAISIDDMMDGFIIESPYYCHRGLCSPCAPNAGHLNTIGEYKTYCLPPNWYQGNIPFDIFESSSGALIARVGTKVED
jgi:hypothetical protein